MNFADGVVFTQTQLLSYLCFINLFTFITMWYDKRCAKKDKWRVSEKALFIFSLIGGSLGGTAGMYIFHHKNKKWYFRFGFPLILIFQAYLLTKYYVI